MESRSREYEQGKLKRRVDQQKKERGGKPFTYGEINEDIVSKRFLPLPRHLWRLYRELGYEVLVEEFMSEVSENMIYDIFKLRLDDTITSARQINEGKNPHPDKTVSWSIYPPVVTLRGDLAQGTMKLIYGNSTDISFIVTDDTSNEFNLILNGHLEDGIPVDWWVVRHDDDLFDRRHLKLGTKFRDLPKKINNYMKLGQRSIEILKDVRNERTPQWATSPYNVATVYTSGIFSFVSEPSMWEVYGALWDGLNAKRIYGMSDYWFGYCPFPPMIGMLMLMSRQDFMVRLLGLSSQHNLVIQKVEEEIDQYLSSLEPELYEAHFRALSREGAYWPHQSLGCIPPDFKSNKTYLNEESLRNWKYPPGDRIKPEHLGMDLDEYRRGIYLDIDHHVEPWSVEPREKILAQGWGSNMDFK